MFCHCLLPATTATLLHIYLEPRAFLDIVQVSKEGKKEGLNPEMTSRDVYQCCKHKQDQEARRK